DDPLPDNLMDNLIEVLETSDTLIASYAKGKMIKEGVKTAIVGKPNVGKSSLLNTILKEERAIVTHIAGTTRDMIEEVINLKGIPLILVDTAGIRATDDVIENIGVKKSEELIDKADLILFVVDGSRELEEEDIKVHDQLKADKVIGILNKIDMERKLDLTPLNKVGKWIEISATENLGISNMEDEIYKYIVSGQVEDSSQKLIITNVRHRSALEKTKQAVENILETINMGLPMDLMAVDLKEALDSLSEVTGEISTEDLLDHVFSNFCVGK
ncbi:tRNA modification GTPase, partial [Ilyobacter sp.]|uniref:tRNA modification GTPase n=1 Tax=Ilyobacter sp. TaxID=3100343 RepID=UPI003562238A